MPLMPLIASPQDHFTLVPDGVVAVPWLMSAHLFRPAWREVS